MLRRTVNTMVVLLGLLPAIALAASDEGSLAERLPADKTVFYAEVDVRGVLDDGQRALAFVDQDAGQKVVFRVKELYGLLRELCAAYEFEPMLFDSIADAQFYFVVVAMDEPQVKVHTQKVPKFDPQTWEMIPGEFDEQTYTERKSYVPSFVIKAPDEETAADFVEQFTAFLDMQKEKEPESQEYDRLDIDVEQGELELIGDADEQFTLGRLGRHIIASDGNPRELWAALMAQPDSTLSETPLYARLGAGDRKAKALMLVNIERFVRQAEDGLLRDLEEAEEKAASDESAGEGGGSENWQVAAARASHSAFLVFKKLFSLDQCKQAGGSGYFSASEDKIVSEFTGLFAHGENISPILEELLTGSGSFALPGTGKLDSMCMMGRVSLSSIYDSVLQVLADSEPEASAQFAMSMQAMKMSVGVTLGEIFQLLASDYYVFVDMIEKEVETPRYEVDDETGEMNVTTEKHNAVVPQTTFLWGVSDPEAAKDTLSKMFTTLAARADANQFVKKRAYQETDVFCVGMNVADPDSYPDGMTSVAVTIVGRYLSFGSWEHVTKIIRRTKAREREVDSELQAIVDGHADSNLLVVVPRACQQKFQELVEKVQGEQQTMLDRLLEQWESAGFELEDEQLAERIKTSIQELNVALKELNEKANALAQTSVMSGTHKGQFYEVEAGAEMTK